MICLRIQAVNSDYDFQLRVLTVKSEVSKKCDRHHRVSLVLPAAEVEAEPDSGVRIRFAESEHFIRFPEGCEGEVEFEVLRKRAKKAGKRGLLAKIASAVASAGSAEEKVIASSVERIPLRDGDGSGERGLFEGVSNIEEKLWGGRSGKGGLLKGLIDL